MSNWNWKVNLTRYVTAYNSTSQSVAEAVLAEQMFRSPVWTKLPDLQLSPIHDTDEVSMIMTVF
jgi:hypothetical protein